MCVLHRTIRLSVANAYESRNKKCNYEYYCFLCVCFFSSLDFESVAANHSYYYFVLCCVHFILSIRTHMHMSHRRMYAHKIYSARNT